MKKLLFSFFVFCFLVSCSDKKTAAEYPVIDVINSIGKYQKVYCSDIFLSIELIPLETKDDCLLNDIDIILNDNVILMRGHKNNQLYAFDRTGQFKNEIGRKGQGPGEYKYLGSVFFNSDKPTIFVESDKILEYDYDGNFINSYNKPNPEGKEITRSSYIGDNIFIGCVYYDGKTRFKYCLFDHKGDTVKTFPNHIFYNRAGLMLSTHDSALDPLRVDNLLYLKDYINDTIYYLTDLTLQPAYVFGFSKHTFSNERLENSNPEVIVRSSDFRLLRLVGFPNYFFYEVRVPEKFSYPESKPVYVPFINQYYSTSSGVYGIYNITEKTNILLDTDQYLQKGIINDINGGLPFIPRYYAGKNIVADVWRVEEMKEMLTDEYFASQTIRDQLGHEELKKLLKILKDDDNPVVVIAKLK